MFPTDIISPPMLRISPLHPPSFHAALVSSPPLKIICTAYDVRRPVRTVMVRGILLRSRHAMKSSYVARPLSQSTTNRSLAPQAIPTFAFGYLAHHALICSTSSVASLYPLPPSFLDMTGYLSRG